MTKVNAYTNCVILMFKFSSVRVLFTDETTQTHGREKGSYSSCTVNPHLSRTFATSSG